MKRKLITAGIISLTAVTTMANILAKANHQETQAKSIKTIQIEKTAADNVQEKLPKQVKPVPLPIKTSGSASVKPMLLANRPILGSSDYIYGIHSIEITAGYNAALNRIIADVDRYGSDLDKYDSPDTERFYRLVSSIIEKIGHVDMRTHYFRNKLNRMLPPNLKSLLRLNASLPLHKRWKLLPVNSSMFHMQGKDGEYNLKFESYDGFREAVYNKNGMLLDEKTDPVNMGTFNYAAGMSGVLNAHLKYDMEPYYIWGNTPGSPQKGRQAIMEGTAAAHRNYMVHIDAVTKYRESIMHSGREV